MMKAREQQRVDEYVEEKTEERGRLVEVVRLALSLSEEEVSDWMDKSFERWWKKSVHGLRQLTATFD